MYTQLYEQITDALVQNGYIVLDDAINKELTQKLLNCAKTKNDFHKAGISSNKEQHLDNTKRSDETSWIDGESSVEEEYLNFTEGLKEYLNRSLYLGLSYYEAHFAIYRDGDFYEKHLDAFKGSKNRVVTTVFYLNDEWQSCDGGALLIYNEKDTLLKTITPNAGTLVVFMSEKFPHEVLQAKKTRYSIAGWFRIDKHE